MENLGVQISANLDQLNSGISAAISKVQGFGKAVEGLPAPKLPAPQLASSEIDKVLDSLNAKLRVAQGNVEIFGNQFQGDKLKIIAYQQALNQLLAQGINPTSKEVLNLANNIELLGKKTERQQAILDRQAGRAAAAFKPQEGILQNLQRNIDLYRQKMERATDTKSIENYRQTIQNLEAQVRKLGSTGPQAINQVNTAANRLSGSANQVGMEFARIIQDAPYGMMGIGNNIQQLSSNFGQLRAQAGSTGGAMKAALAGLVSPMSLVTIGISVLTAGWVLYEKWQQKSAKSTAETAAELRKNKDSVEDYIKSLNGVTQARLTGERSAQQELTTLRLLYKQTQNTTLSTKERQKAVDELQKQYPTYFGNLKDEDILVGKAATAYDKLSSSIIATARARAAQELIAEKARQQLVNEQKITDLIREEIAAGKEQIAQKETLEKVNKRLRDSGDNSQAGAASLLQAKTEGDINKIVAERKNLLNENLRLSKEMAALESTASLDLTTSSNAKGVAGETRDALKELEKGFNQATKEAIVFGSSFDEMGVKAGLFKTAITDLLPTLGTNNDVIKGLKSSYDFFSGTTLPTATGAIERFTNQDFTPLHEGLAEAAKGFNVIPVAMKPMTEEAAAFWEKLVLDAQSAMSKIKITAEQMTSFMQGQISNAITGFAEAFGQLAGTGDIDSFFDNIIGIVADFAGNFGKMLIGAGVAALAFESLLANPLAAIGAGVALVAAAGAVKSLLQKGPKGGSSPSVSTGSTASSNFGRPERGASAGPSTLITRIHGRELQIILQSESAFTKRFGG